MNIKYDHSELFDNSETMPSSIIINETINDLIGTINLDQINKDFIKLLVQKLNKIFPTRFKNGRKIHYHIGEHLEKENHPNFWYVYGCYMLEGEFKTIGRDALMHAAELGHKEAIIKYAKAIAENDATHKSYKDNSLFQDSYKWYKKAYYEGYPCEDIIEDLLGFLYHFQTVGEKQLVQSQIIKFVTSLNPSIANDISNEAIRRNSYNDFIHRTHIPRDELVNIELIKSVRSRFSKHLDPQGVKKLNNHTVEEYFRELLDKFNHASLYFEYGKYLLNDGWDDEECAFEMFRKAAELGHLDATVEYAKFLTHPTFHNGYSYTEPDFNEVLDWFGSAISLGCAKERAASELLGRIYELYEDVCFRESCLTQENIKLIINFLEEIGANSEVAELAMHYGASKENGSNGMISYAQAKDWYEIAVRKGNSDAIDILDRLNRKIKELKRLRRYLGLEYFTSEELKMLKAKGWGNLPEYLVLKIKDIEDDPDTLYPSRRRSLGDSCVPIFPYVNGHILSFIESLEASEKRLWLKAMLDKENFDSYITA
jgi:hypothetical protein